MRYLPGILLAIFLIISFTYKSNEIKSPTSRKAWEHSIILDLEKSSDKKLAQTLKYSSYICRALTLDTFIECSIKNNIWQSFERPNVSNNRLMTSHKFNGDTLRVFESNDGSAHLEIFDSEKGVHHLYSFTSAQNLELYSQMYQGEILPKKLGSRPLNLF